MIPLPKSFDENEWFVLITLFIMIAFTLYLPRRFPISLTILICLFAIFIANLSDHLFATSITNFYNIMDSRKYELFDYLLYLLYAPFVYLFVYQFEKWNLKGYYILLFLIGWSIVGTVFEWVSHLFKVFHYKEWKIWYSLTAYLITQPLTLLFFTFLKNSYHTNQQSK
ncbi:hypothetical protein [Bacillus methanolicus]|uniref:Putative membrane protein n=1 Tax=Bacillus methanolicus (strain MGA3 / ATCC 53907) TaxID=796606 RepID=I3E8U7_BACMM|nr:hypothetical protein [Bacillus methanolicus]AIE60183.1 putative membrane protein [Bacillus methanolicus MGA3]EIJ82918.1 hypothetical protein MGA3_06820 [Bacillus methanolicus MGA3]